MIHVAPDEIEWDKLDRSDDAGERAAVRTEIELQLGRDAHRVVTIGPRLHGRYVNEFSAYGTPVPLRIDPGFDGADIASREPPPGTPWKVLLFGRTEDAPVKGLDLAAKAVGLAAQRRGTAAHPIEFIVRGAPLGASASLRRQLRTWAELPSLSVVVRPYVTDAERLAADLRVASLVLMPSRSEGFGLVGVEAITAGTPMLVSGSSGLGELLTELLDPEDAMRFVIAVSGDDDKDADELSRAVEGILRDRDAAFRRAGELRRRLAKMKTWSRAAADLLAALD